MDIRPILDTAISIRDFKEFYWLKEELVEFCRKEGLKTAGSKRDISARIERYLISGERSLGAKERKSSSSKFDWQKEILSSQTLITDNYRNTENVRQYFKEEIGYHFKFNVKFMNWMRAHVGRNLGDATEEWRRIQWESKASTKIKNIAPQFEYNRYLRDFLLDNPKMGRKVGIKLWHKKKKLRGDNRYDRRDLQWIGMEP